jgi:hypothetical protein
MEFWYFHDTVESEDYMDVRITTDGGATYTQLLSLLKQNAVYGWAHYTADLTPYVNGQCINILFEAMQISFGTATQYIDSININSFPDMAISELLLPEISVCERENKNIGIVLSAAANRAIDLAQYNTSLIVEIPNRPADIIPLNKRMERNSSDTVWLSNVDFLSENNTIRAYLSTPVDIFSANDTLDTTIVVNPSLSVRVEQLSGGNSNCLSGELDVYQSVTITNDGNMELSDIGLILQIDTGVAGTPAYIILRDTCTDIIPANSSVTYTFKTPYVIPWNTYYYAGITASLLCDPSLANDNHEEEECVDTKDLYMVSIDHPSGTSLDNVGDHINATVTIRNRGDENNYPAGISITVKVENSQGVETETFKETTAAIGLSATISHSFTRSYTVPNDSVYYLTVYIEPQDNYPGNDTKTIKRTVNKVGISSLGIDGFALEQNTPNPANNSTRIDYVVPEAGEVIFQLQSISGQILYSKTIEATHGTNSVELNTSTLSAGIYLYWVEYKGQRLVKRMIVQP